MKRKTLACCLALGMLLMSGCAVPSEEPTEEIPQYSTDKRLLISGWVAPPAENNYPGGNPDFITEERYMEIAEAGFTHIYGFYESANMDNAMRALDCAEKAGIKYFVRDAGLRLVTNYDLIPNMVARYADHPAFGGNLIQDEPPFSDFPIYAKLYPHYKEALPDKTFYVNMVPSYASSSTWLQGHTYKEFATEWLDTVKPDHYSYDFYPLLTNSIHDQFLWNLEIVANLTQERDIPFYVFIQSLAYNGHRDPSYEEIKFQFYTNMAYGAQGMQYFCYWTPYNTGGEWFGDGLITKDGQRTKRYDYAKSINHEVRNFEQVYLSFDWQGTMPLLADSAKPNASFNRLETPLREHKRILTSTVSEDTIVGAFKDGENRDGFMIVNYTDPALKKVDEVKFKFVNASRAMYYKNGEQKIVDIENGVFRESLQPGEGIFVIPF